MRSINSAATSAREGGLTAGLDRVKLSVSCEGQAQSEERVCRRAFFTGREASRIMETQFGATGLPVARYGSSRGRAVCGPTGYDGSEEENRWSCKQVEKRGGVSWREGGRGERYPVKSGGWLATGPAPTTTPSYRWPMGVFMPRESAQSVTAADASGISGYRGYGDVLSVIQNVMCMCCCVVGCSECSEKQHHYAPVDPISST